MRRAIAVLAAGVLLAAACREPTPPAGTAEPVSADPKTAPASASEAAPSAGEADDAAFCKKHGVAEAVCTKCNPALIPVFKAKGDWCEEHGFPESFCPICHPERGGKPAVAIAGDDGPADGTKVMFKTHDTARLAGIQTVAAVEGSAGAHVLATAKIVYDASGVARVNARSAGVVMAVRADIGTRVGRGAPLAVIESADVGADQSRQQAARARVEVAEANRTRVTKLHQEGIVPEVDVLEARKEVDEAQADLDAARRSLGMVGGTTEGTSRYTLASPLAGVVTSRDVTIGRMVDTEQTLFEIVDTREVWAEVDIPETDVAAIVPRQHVTLTVDGLGERVFSGELTYIAPEIDPHTRTARGRIQLANADGALRANMFARARLAVAAGRTSVLVPRAAVQRARNARLVFVRVSEQVYEARRVSTGPAEDGLVAVTGRIRPGDRVVTEGSFLLKTETLKESIGAGCCGPESK